MHCLRSWSSVLGATLIAVSASAVTVDPELMKVLRSNASGPGPITVVVHLPGRLLPSELKKLNLSEMTQLQRGRAVARALEAFNRDSSRAMKRFLASPSNQPAVQEVTPLWITNSLRVRASREVVTKMLSMNGIESLVLDSGKPVDEMLDDVGNASVAPTPGAQVKMNWGIEKMRAEKVWEAGNQGKGALVAMIDSGANIHHPDLAPNIWRNPGEIGADDEGNDKSTNGVDDDGNGYVDDVVGWNFQEKNGDVSDDNGHGSQTAGLVGGMGAGGTQTGIAPKATLMILRSCCGGSNEVFESNTWEAIQYAMKNGAKVISMSLSAKPPSKPNYSKWRQLGEVELETGIIHVNSAGNLGSGREPHNIGAPATNPPAWFHPDQGTGTSTSMITIGASDQNDKVRRYSSKGPITWQGIEEYKDFPYEKEGKPGLMKPEVCGPSEMPSTSMDGKSYTKSFGGTSSATPAVAGVVALLVAERPSLTPAQATEALEASATKISQRFDNNCGAGRVDAVAAIEFVRTHF